MRLLFWRSPSTPKPPRTRVSRGRGVLLGVPSAQTGGSTLTTTGTIAQTVPFLTQAATGTVTQPATYTRAARGRGVLLGVPGQTAGSSDLVAIPATARPEGLEVVSEIGRVNARGYNELFLRAPPRPQRPAPRAPVPVPAVAHVMGRTVESAWARPVARGAACASVTGRESTSAWSRPVAVGEHLGEREDEDFLLLALL